MNEKQRSEEHYAEVAEHQGRGDANEANSEGTICPEGEPIEATGKYAEQPAGESDSGYPGQGLGRGKKKRKPLAEVASSDRFGRPYR